MTIKTITLPFSEGDRVRRDDGVEFVIERWSRGPSALAQVVFYGHAANGQGVIVAADRLTLVSEPPATVLVEMSVDDARRWAASTPWRPVDVAMAPIYRGRENVVILGCRAALRKAGLSDE